MIAISAPDSVSLAIQRTRDFLFRPFKWGTFLKLCLVAMITEGLGSNFNSSSHKGSSSGHGPIDPSTMHWTPECIAAIVGAVLLALLLAFWVAYLVTRLRFAFFHCLTTNTREIKPGWRLYRTQAMRFLWLNVVVGLCFVLLVVVIAIPFVAGFIQLYHQSQQNGHPDVGLMISLALPLIPIIFLLIVLGIVTDIVLRDWMLPHYALDDATAGEAWREVWAAITAEKKQFFVYVLLRVVLPFIASIGVVIVLIIPGLCLAGALAAIEYSLHSVLANSTGAAAVVGKILEAFFGLLAAGFAILASICLGGPVSTGTREFALVFYGGRYRELGDMLFPPPPPVGGSPEIA
jgi:hypothetical protein